ncbi:hypothetical protein CP10139811_0949 [Chlamydia ibidis]|uniref:Uncharacterized protein n=2 Tax=Chlamydia ibidis TaxID=1405396 RepID=S7J4S4_9CHLA|nr:hypothetical protein CP10139811_0949 [Chlamydia ibidis]EQM62973.1 hypothetical protein H359_0269 [Chlamydia ibidis 10-1398/6]
MQTDLEKKAYFTAFNHRNWNKKILTKIYKSIKNNLSIFKCFSRFLILL